MQNAPPHSAPVIASLIVPAHNAEHYLPRCLGAINASRPPSTELIVVDDTSIDSTAAIARAAGAQVISGRWRNPGPARNAGAAAARGLILIFLDADTVPAPPTIHQLISALDDPQVHAVFGSYDAAPDAPQAVSQFKNLMHHFVHQQHPGPASTFWTGCGAIRRNVFEEVGGLRPVSIRCVEDIDLGMRLHQRGYNIILRPDIQVKHLKRWTIPSLIKVDIFTRAIPWTYMMLSARQRHTPLNASHTEQVALVLAFTNTTLIVAAMFHPAYLAAAAATFATFIIMKRDILAFYHRHKGFLFLLLSVLLLHVYYLYSAIGLAGGIGLYLYDKLTRKQVKGVDL